MMNKLWQAFKDIAMGAAVIFIPVTIINLAVEYRLFFYFIVVVIVVLGCGLIGWMIRDTRVQK
jgi:hypothetical protein